MWRGLGVGSLSKSSSCNAVSIALRTRDDVDESADPSESGGRGGRSLEDATELGRSERADGRRAGNVLMEPVTAVPDDLELALMELILLARDEASFANLDCDLGGVGVGGKITGVWTSLDFEFISGMEGMLSREEIGSLVENG